MEYNELSRNENDTRKQIDALVIGAFGTVELPIWDKGSIEIKRISEIHKIAQTIRQLRYAPKITINGSSVTAQFIAGFVGQEPRYVESLYIRVSKYSSHPQINSLFKDLDPHSGAEHDTHFLNIVDDFEFKKNDRAFLRTDEIIDAVSSKKSPIKSNFDSLTGLAVECLCIERLPDIFSNEVDLFCSKISNIAKEPELSNRLIAIWFLAESFRYPPMLFYSLIILHCYMNGYINRKELDEGFHPSLEKGSQQTQFSCYAKGSGFGSYSIKPTRSSKEMQNLYQEMQGFYASTRNILRTFYKKIEENLKKKCKCNGFKDFTEDELKANAERIFNLHIRYYLSLCGVEPDELEKFKWINESACMALV